MNVQLNSRRLQRDCRAFTLVELLVVISIITLLASTALFAMFGVREDVRESRARAQVAKINELIMEKWETYRTRAVPVDPSISRPNPREAGLIRLRALRALMRMELPDRKADLLIPVTDNAADKPSFLASQPKLWQNYVRRARAQVIAHYLLQPTDVNAWQDNDRWNTKNESSECLYLILSAIREADTTGLDFFPTAEIGDTDNDGMPEILDPWKKPIQFLRWAPGFQSDIQKGDIVPNEDGNAGVGNGDAFDPLKSDDRWRDAVTDNDPFLLFPLVFSCGRDKEPGIGLSTLSDKSFASVGGVSTYLSYLNDPYERENDLTAIGSVVSATATDNITNHLPQTR